MRFLRHGVLVLVASLLGVASATAQITIPNAFTTRQVISSSKMNANFNQLGLQALNRTAPVLQADLVPDVTATRALGTSLLKFTNLFLSGQVNAATGVFTSTLSAVGITNTGNGTVSGTFQVTGSTTLSTLVLTTLTCTGCVTSTNILDGTIADADVNAAAAIAWTKISKTGSSIADLTSHAVANLSDGSNVALLNAVNTFTAGGTHTFAAAVVGGGNIIKINNTQAAGAGQYAGFQADSDNSTYSVLLRQYSGSASPGYTGSNGNGAGVFQSGGPGGIAIDAAHGSGGIGFYTGGTTQRWGINPAGDFTFGSSSHIADSVGTPTITSGGGTAPGISGSDYAFNVIVGGSPGSTAIRVGFGHTWTPTACVASKTSLGGANVRVSVGVNLVDLLPVDGSGVSTIWAQNDVIYVMCRGV